MSRYLLDTEIASDLVNSRHGVEQKARKVSQQGLTLGIGTPGLGELVAGIQISNDPDRPWKLYGVVQ